MRWAHIFGEVGTAVKKTFANLIRRGPPVGNVAIAVTLECSTFATPLPEPPAPQVGTSPHDRRPRRLQPVPPIERPRRTDRAGSTDLGSLPVLIKNLPPCRANSEISLMPTGRLRSHLLPSSSTCLLRNIQEIAERKLKKSAILTFHPQ